MTDEASANVVLTRDLLLAHGDKSRLKLESLFLERLGATVQISELSQAEADALDDRVQEVGPDGKMRLKFKGYNAQWALATLCNPDGSKMFTARDPH